MDYLERYDYVRTVSSVHKDPRGKSKYWYCCYTTAEGKRRMVSTEEEDQQKAKIICTGWQDAPIESITERDIDGFVDHLLKDGRSASTINKLVRKYLSGAFEKARKLGKIRYNPVAATDPLPSDSTVKDVFSAEQVARLVKAA